MAQQVNRRMIFQAANAYHGAAQALWDLVDGEKPITLENVRWAKYLSEQAAGEGIYFGQRMLTELPDPPSPRHPRLGKTKSAKRGAKS